MSEFALFIEGGGPTKSDQGPLRTAFQNLLRSTLDRARDKKVRHRVALCGGRAQTIKLYLNERRQSPQVTSFLLVDAEECPEMQTSAREHLALRDEARLREEPEAFINMMVVTMETWLLADTANLRRYFGPQLIENQLPLQQNLEALSKQEVNASLENATRISSKGRYHKQKHGPDLLSSVDPELLKSRCPSFASFVNLLDAFVAGV